MLRSPTPSQKLPFQKPLVWCASWVASGIHCLRLSIVTSTCHECTDTLSGRHLGDAFVIGMRRSWQPLRWRWIEPIRCTRWISLVARHSRALTRELQCSRLADGDFFWYCYLPKGFALDVYLSPSGEKLWTHGPYYLKYILHSRICKSYSKET